MYIWGDFVVGAVFWLLSGLILFAALMVVTVKNIIHAALWLISSFAGVAALYFLLEAPFIGVVQILVYTGAVSILVLFAIMLTRQVTGERTRQLFSRWWVAAILAVMLFGGVMVPAIWSPEIPRSQAPDPTGEEQLAAGEVGYWPQVDRSLPEASPAAEEAGASPAAGEADGTSTTSEGDAGDEAGTEGVVPQLNIAGALEIGTSFMREYLMPFWISSVLLLVALIGAIVIAYEERTRRRRILTLAEEAELRRSVSGLGIERPMQATADIGDAPEAGTAERG
jgi:NADH-quinone oxidoreductase subunit J